jgi:hypothetical protein
MTALAAVEKKQAVTIAPPNLQVATFKIVGTAPFLQHRFWKKAEMMETQEQGTKAQSKRKRKPRDFEKDYQESMYKSEEGWHGIPASSFRNAMISACRLVDFKMTRAKLSVFIIADGLDPRDGIPLVKITKGKPEKNISPARNDNGSIDLRARALWKSWEMMLKVKFDADQFSLEDVTNLLQRAGAQVGVGEGRPDSKNSAGLGFGTFEISKD